MITLVTQQWVPSSRVLTRFSDNSKVTEKSAHYCFVRLGKLLESGDS
jgi:hypothetical protein